MNSSSSTFDDSLFGCSSADKKASSKSINAVSSKYQASKSQFLNYKHNCKAMREAQKSLSESSIWVVVIDNESEDSLTDSKPSEFEYVPCNNSESEIRVVY